MTLHCFSFALCYAKTLRCNALSIHFHPVLHQRCCAQGAQTLTHHHLFDTRLFYFIRLVLNGGGWKEVTTLIGVSLLMKPKLQPWSEHMVSPVFLEPVGLFWMEPLVKTGFVAACHAARLCLSPSFWQGLASRRAPGQQNERGTAGQFRADCCPAGISLHVLPACLVDTHKHTEGDLARRPAFFCSLWCICVPWLASSFGFDEQAIKGQVAQSEGYKFNQAYSHFSSV